jgi:outer membrane protein assembly factor BamB
VVTGPAKQYQGPRSSPAVAEGKVLALGAGGVLTCLDATTGKVTWKKDDLTNDLPRFFTSASPLIVDGLGIVHLGGLDKGCLIAVSIKSGDVRWKWEDEGPSYSSALPLTLGGSKQVVLLTEKSLMGLALADGKPQWQIPTPLNPGYWNSATPMVDGQNVYYSGQGTGIRAVRIEKTGENISARPLWHNEQIGTVYNTPILRDNLLFGLSDRGQYFCLDAQTGSKVWVSTNRVSNFGTLLSAGEVLVGLPEKSDLVFFKSSRQGYEELAHYKVSDTPVYSFPVLSENRIFIRDRDSISLWTIAAKAPNH